MMDFLISGENFEFLMMDFVFFFSKYVVGPIDIYIPFKASLENICAIFVRVEKGHGRSNIARRAFHLAVFRTASYMFRSLFCFMRNFNSSLRIFSKPYRFLKLLLTLYFNREFN